MALKPISFYIYLLLRDTGTRCVVRNL